MSNGKIFLPKIGVCFFVTKVKYDENIHFQTTVEVHIVWILRSKKLQIIWNRKSKLLLFRLACAYLDNFIESLTRNYATFCYLVSVITLTWFSSNLFVWQSKDSPLSVKALKRGPATARVNWSGMKSNRKVSYDWVI